jgi:hypothetical protein
MVAFIDDHRAQFRVEPICRVLVQDRLCDVAPLPKLAQQTFWDTREGRKGELKTGEG